MYVVMLFATLLVFIYAPNEQMQGIVQKIFYFHVSSSVTAFSAFFLVFVASIMYLWKNAEWWDAVALSAAEIGVVFCTLVLITGPIWARPIWGTWWSWDPALTLTLVLWLIYVAYLMLRMDAHDPKRARFAAVKQKYSESFYPKYSVQNAASQQECLLKRKTQSKNGTPARKNIG